MGAIHFFTEDISFEAEHPQSLKSWIRSLAKQHDFSIDTLNYIFCSDAYLLDINRTYLDHDYYTDIITFDNSLEPHTILSDIFISIDRVNENAQDMQSSFQEELHRVMAHGLIHLFGYRDKTEDEKILMRQKEDACLSLLKIPF